MYKAETKSIDDKIRDFEKWEFNAIAIRAYRFWTNLTDSQKQFAWDSWKSYYTLCSESEASKVFWNMREVFKKGNKSQLRVLLQENQTIKDTSKKIEKPRCIDPYWYFNNSAIATYRGLLEDKNKQNATPKNIDEVAIFN